ncbi:hypothetical protein BG006_002976 [Podila minutissima]|uniref:Erythromycin esterase n=1 Tax=Podila minutissima TaxID=64525 RepID=A0A9P5S8Y8_9FUNG|nr:hypothetical protein BG006_002976 [Podila minutissima]
MSNLHTLIRSAAEEFNDIDEPSFAAKFDRFGGAKVVLIGDASHGTSEFYKARAAITKRLIEEHGLNISMHAVIDFLDGVDLEAAKVARKRYGCLDPWVENPAQYGLVSLKIGHAPCQDAVVKVLQDLFMKRMEYAREADEGLINAMMNAQLVRDAEEYYRAIYLNPDLSWNLRDTHMFTVLSFLSETRGAKAVVWAHNSHVGDARYTGMGMRRSEISIGQLCKEKYGKDAVIIGCGTHTGTVAAAHEWGGRMVTMSVQPSLKGSYERVMFDSGVRRFLLDMSIHKELRQQLIKPRLERFIGVIYRSATERWSHYSEAILPKQMDAYIWFQESTAVKAFERDQPAIPPSADDTYPFGL